MIKQIKSFLKALKNSFKYIFADSFTFQSVCYDYILVMQLSLLSVTLLPECCQILRTDRYFC